MAFCSNSLSLLIQLTVILSLIIFWSWAVSFDTASALLEVDAFCISDLHADGVRKDPDFVGPELEADAGNDHLTEREYVSFIISCRPWCINWLRGIFQPFVTCSSEAMHNRCSILL